jgi:DNA polymerase-3 subunit alpha
MAINIDSLLSDSIFGHDDSIALAKKFIRKCPKNDIYISRLCDELKLIVSKNLATNIFRVCEILELIHDIPHIIRGSSGSSLVCYLLGITNIDPIKENISFSRFLNKYRNKLPDFDIDIPHNKHDIAFARISKKWNSKVARISNHVCYGEKGAKKKAEKVLGLSKKKALNDSEKELVLAKKTEYLGKFKNYSLHCGGIIFFKDDIPDDLLIKKKKPDVINQIKYNKDDIEQKGFFKIDILSNRGLTQLFNIQNTPVEDYIENEIVFNSLQDGKNIGITFAESPGMRKVFITNKPKSIMDLAKCLAIIRPMANDVKIYDDVGSASKVDSLVFDDDAIFYIMKKSGCDEGLADKFRRAFAKGDWKIINQFGWLIKDDPDKEKVKKKLLNLKKYSFCKSHAISYAKLVYALAYHKVFNPKKFWISTINTCQSMYRSWVHYREAKLAGLKICLGGWPYRLSIDETQLVALNKINADDESLDTKYQFEKYGYWIQDDFYPGCKIKVINKDTNLVEFNGLIACSRWCRKWINNKYNYYTYLTIGYKNGLYIDLKIKDKWLSIKKYNLITGNGIFKEICAKNHFGMINVNDFTLKIN